MDRAVWRATVHGVTKSQTQPSNYHYYYSLSYGKTTHGHAPGHRYAPPLTTAGIFSLTTEIFALRLTLFIHSSPMNELEPYVPIFGFYKNKHRMYILILIRYVYTDLLKQILSNLKIAIEKYLNELQAII